ncbi:hypothetical protein DYI81_03465 [Acinetobacter sp. SWAC5]|uniref:hypothetical protein n=1 Tax=Acinetobacter sp. SWAC5 TaxID=2293835 RepID=UPI000E34B470|nr:hypothetical protein [Acinetobacter sp. SWAC5]RFS34571.1 hypothetical protein DYI81_03465 [Acinetobacter sp. SWAC5]
MYQLHPSLRLQKLFKDQPYQGCCPIDAKYLFIGLDANYSADIEKQDVFPFLLQYHQNGVEFWRKYNMHHPFLHKNYKGDGKKYHQSFAKIGLTCELANEISFIELLHVPTVGRNMLTIDDLNEQHLDYINCAIFSNKKKAVFISNSVFMLMRKSKKFNWLSDPKSIHSHHLQVFYDENTVVYKHFHFSNYGKFQARKEIEAKEIYNIIQSTSSL